MKTTISESLFPHTLITEVHNKTVNKDTIRLFIKKPFCNKTINEENNTNR